MNRHIASRSERDATKARPASPAQRRVLGTAALLLAVLLPGQAFAQPTSDPTDLLRPADMSSPRDTLRSFLENTKEALELRAAGRRHDDRQVVATRMRALETLDLSRTADWHLWTTEAR